VAQLVEALDAQRPRHALLAAEEVDHHGDVVAAHVLEEQRRSNPLDHAVGDLGDLQLAGDGRADALQLPALFQQREKLAQVRKRHRYLSRYAPSGFIRAEQASHATLRPDRLYA